MRFGVIALIKGTSRSGKTSIVKALRNQLTEPCLEAGFDKFIWMMPERYPERPLWDDVLGLAVKAGDSGQRLFSGMHHAIAALAHSGNNVIADHVLVDMRRIKEFINLFSLSTVYAVGMHCPPGVREEREQARRNRTLGQAAAQFPLVHAYMKYDVAVDTSLLDPIACARRIIALMQSKQPPTALKSISPDDLPSQRGQL